MNDGATLYTDDQQTWHFRWDGVTRIDTYKCDLLTVDLICIDFSVASRQSLYSTHEEMQNFDVLCSKLQSFFPSIAADWWIQVALPAFATNHNVLYEAFAVSSDINALPNSANPV